MGQPRTMTAPMTAPTLLLQQQQRRRQPRRHKPWPLKAKWATLDPTPGVCRSPEHNQRLIDESRRGDLNP